MPDVLPKELSQCNDTILQDAWTILTACPEDADALVWLEHVRRWPRSHWQDFDALLKRWDGLKGSYRTKASIASYPGSPSLLYRSAVTYNSHADTSSHAPDEG